MAFWKRIKNRIKDQANFNAWTSLLRCINMTFWKRVRIKDQANLVKHADSR